MHMHVHVHTRARAHTHTPVADKRGNNLEGNKGKKWGGGLKGGERTGKMYI